jgi:hypothetical protein
MGQTASPTPAAIVAHRHPKASKIGSPRRLDAVGENLIEKWGEPLLWAGRAAVRSVDSVYEAWSYSMEFSLGK